jgi:hypothetical protein
MVDKIKAVQIAIEHGESMSYQAEIIAVEARNLQTQLIEFEKENPSPDLRAFIKALGAAQTMLTANVEELETKLSGLYDAQTRYDLRLKA